VTIGGCEGAADEAAGEITNVTPRVPAVGLLVIVELLIGRGVPARLLRLDVELLAESAPLVLLFADDLRSALRRAAAVSGQTERQEPLFDIRAAEVAIDLAIELRDHLGWCACRRDNGKKAVHDDARHGFAQRRYIWQAREALARSHREPAHLAGLDDSIRGRD